MRRYSTFFIIIISVCCFIGCANPGIIKLSPDTYMITRQDNAGIFGNAARMKANVIRDANEFAAEQGKVAIPLVLNERPMVPGGYGRVGTFATIEYQFRVVDKNDPEALRTHLINAPDVKIQRDDTLKADIDVKTKEEKDKTPDLYSELIKLEDLKERGILTQEEFELQKKRLLER